MFCPHSQVFYNFNPKIATFKLVLDLTCNKEGALGAGQVNSSTSFQILAI